MAHIREALFKYFKSKMCGWYYYTNLFHLLLTNADIMNLTFGLILLLYKGMPVVS